MKWTRSDLSCMADAELLTALDALNAKDHRLTAELLLHLSEVDRRKLYLGQACASMFSYCVQRLHMSEPTAYKRVRVARAAADFPAILEAVASGSVHLSAVTLLVPHLTAGNHRDLLAAARHRSKREVEVLIANRFPVADAPSVVRRLPVSRQRAQLGGETIAAGKTVSSTTAVAPVAGPQVHNRPPACIKPTGNQRYRLALTIDGDMHAKLLRAQALLRHQVPNGDLTALIDRALTLLVDELERTKFGRRRSARDVQGGGKSSGSPVRGRNRSRHIPNPIRREVAARDGARCTFIDSRGRRCSETGMLEFHHCEPYAHGGTHSADNITLRCRAHNQHAARQDLGEAASQWLKLREAPGAAYRVSRPSRAA